jgi:hypothetical protein
MTPANYTIDPELTEATLENVPELSLEELEAVSGGLAVSTLPPEERDRSSK